MSYPKAAEASSDNHRARASIGLNSLFLQSKVALGWHDNESPRLAASLVNCCLWTTCRRQRRTGEPKLSLDLCFRQGLPRSFLALLPALRWLERFFTLRHRPCRLGYVLNPHRETTFYTAAICDPSLFDNLYGTKVLLWFPEAEDASYPDGALIVQGGTTAVTRARDITLYGADSSFGAIVFTPTIGADTGKTSTSPCTGSRSTAKRCS
jgi:hypothetical protein